jgi:hypothetical protein
LPNQTEGDNGGWKNETSDSDHEKRRQTGRWVKPSPT